MSEQHLFRKSTDFSSNTIVRL